MDYRSDGDLAEVIMRGLASAVRSEGALTDTQSNLLGALGKYLIGSDTPPAELEPISP
jgi:hypothetical protein